MIKVLLTKLIRKIKSFVAQQSKLEVEYKEVVEVKYVKYEVDFALIPSNYRADFLKSIINQYMIFVEESINAKTLVEKTNRIYRAE
jgi:hypothetical protein